MSSGWNEASVSASSPCHSGGPGGGSLGGVRGGCSQCQGAESLDQCKFSLHGWSCQWTDAGKACIHEQIALTSQIICWQVRIVTIFQPRSSQDSHSSQEVHLPCLGTGSSQPGKCLFILSLKSGLQSPVLSPDMAASNKSAFLKWMLCRNHCKAP